MLGLRILHIDTGAEMRGGQHQVLLLLKALQDAGHQSTLLARRKSPLWQAASEAGIPVYRASARNLWKYSKRSQIVHAHDAGAHTLAALASRQKFVVSRRVAFPVGRNLASMWKYRKASRFLAVSQFVAKELQTAKIPENKIDVVFDAVENVQSVGTWNPEYPAVALASKDAQKGRDLVELAAKASGIEVLFSDDLPRDLSRASMFIYITRSEGLGSAALLAMNVGIPVIASRVGGLAEVFADGVSGIYVNNEVTEIVRAMRRVLGTRTLAQNLIDGGRARVAECFTVEQLLRSTLNSYGGAFGG
ncbi:MAG: glycosyltransferase family 4 protein [Acidobacteriota bacterium]|nr:glycosyltransferase family 4 protein [Acidobacteriota bacterium]